MQNLLQYRNHYPYKINEEDATIAPDITGDKPVDGYFQTARYADEALRQFFDYLKKSGLYDTYDHYHVWGPLWDFRKS